MTYGEVITEGLSYLYSGGVIVTFMLVAVAVRLVLGMVPRKNL